MEFQKFTQKVTKALYQYYDTKVQIETHQVYKNNGILLQGICALQEGKNIAPTVYLNDFFERYQKGEHLGVLMKEIIRIIEKNQVSESIDLDFFKEYENVKSRLVFRVIHRKKNEELLKEVPFRPFQDLAVVCHCLLLTEEIGTGTILIHKQFLQKWNISEDRLFEDTAQNSPRIEPHCILKMSQIVRSILEDTMREQVEEICREFPQDEDKLLERTVDNMVREMEEQQTPMYVLTNGRRYYGAACMVYPGVLQEIADFLQDDFYILPSSVHEIIFLGKSNALEGTCLNEMIQEVNQTQVEEEEWLSDHAYLYQRDSRLLSCVLDS